MADIIMDKRKLALAGIFALLGVICIILLFKMASLNNSISEKDAQIAELSQQASQDVDETLRERLDSMYAQQTQTQIALSDIRSVAEEYLTALYSAPSSEDYLQAPALSGYLTDDGIKSYLTTADPFTYADLSAEEIEAIREAAQDATITTSGSTNVVSKYIAVDLDDDLTSADVVAVLDINFDGGSRETMTVFCRMGIVNEDSEWKINEITQFEQL